jgi:hypothetical protein
VAGDLRWLVGHPRGASPVLTYCPFHDHSYDTPSYAVYPDGAYCFNPSCHARETAEQFVERVGGDLSKLPEPPGAWEREERRRRFRERDHALAIDTWQRTLHEGSRRHRIDWLLDRGLWPETIKRYRLGHTGDRFSIPALDGKSVVGYQLRVDPEYCYADELKYLNPSGQDPMLIYRPHPTGTPLVVCEGPFDALVLAQAGIDGVTVFAGAGSLTPALEPILKGRRDYLIATDLDEAGHEAAKRLLARFPQGRRLTWDGGKDINEAYLARSPLRRGTWLRSVIGS